MKAVLQNMARWAARKAYRQPAVRRLYVNILKGLKSPINPSSQYTPMNFFSRDNGGKVQLLSGLRDDIKPDWMSMVTPDPDPGFPNANTVLMKAERCQKNIEELANLLRTHGINLQNKRALEIGCYDGIHAYYLSKLTQCPVIASDISSYYVVQNQREKLSADSCARQDSYLDGLRRHCQTQLGGKEATAKQVEFVEDNIVNSMLPDACVDLICSWEVLEHITDPERAFSQMHRLLKNEGICFHEYNPFFCVEGGHSLCTLDFLWGHARLSNGEFDRYVKQFRPREYQIDQNFFHQNLNRMSLKLLTQYAEAAGFVIKALIPWPNYDHVELLEEECLAEVQAEHPTVEVLDLLSPKVWVIFQKVSPTTEA